MQPIYPPSNDPNHQIQYQPNQTSQIISTTPTTPTTVNAPANQGEIVPILNSPGLSTLDTQTYFQQYRNLLMGFKGNVDCRLIPSRKAGDTYVLTKAGAEKICQFFGLNYTLVYHQSSVFDYTNNFFYYAYECRMSRGGIFLGNAYGNCNNHETKYAKTYAPNILHTIDRMAQKRALVGATCFVTGGSRFFGQKLSDLV